MTYVQQNTVRRRIPGGTVRHLTRSRARRSSTPRIVTRSSSSRVRRRLWWIKVSRYARRWRGSLDLAALGEGLAAMFAAYAWQPGVVAGAIDGGVRLRGRSAPGGASHRRRIDFDRSCMRQTQSPNPGIANHERFPPVRLINTDCDYLLLRLKPAAPVINQCAMPDVHRGDFGLLARWTRCRCHFRPPCRLRGWSAPQDSSVGTQPWRQSRTCAPRPGIC